MAINQNTKWPNRNTLYFGRTGSGKSQACKQNPEIPRSGARVLLWDPSHDHKAHHIDSKVTYANQVREALKSGKPFRLAYSGGVSPLDHEWWCDVVWAALDGNFQTFVLSEELSAVCLSIAKAAPSAARLINQGRKYGMVFHGITQKPQEISKTYFDMTEIFYVGQQRGDNVKKCAKLLGIGVDDIEKLEPLEFWRLDPKLNSGKAEFVKMTYEPNNY